MANTFKVKTDTGVTGEATIYTVGGSTTTVVLGRLELSICVPIDYIPSQPPIGRLCCQRILAHGSGSIDT